MNVFELSANWLRLDELLEESAGDLTPEIEALQAELITEAKGSLEQVGQYRNWIQSQVQVCKDRRAALSATAERLEAKLDRVDAALVNVLKALGKPQRFPEFTLSTTTRENLAFAVLPDTCIADLPERFVRFKDPELNLPALKEAAKEGHLPAGIQVESTTNTSVMQRKPTKKGEAQKDEVAA